MLIEHRIKIQHERREREMLAIRERFARQEEDQRLAAQARRIRVDQQAQLREAREKARWDRRRWSLQIIELARAHGWARVLPQVATKLKPPHYVVVDTHSNPEMGQLVKLQLPELQIISQFLVAHCPRNGTIVEGVPLMSEIDGLAINSVLAAQAWRIGDPLAEYLPPPRRT